MNHNLNFIELEEINTKENNTTTNTTNDTTIVHFIDDCSICLEEVSFGSKNVYILPCLHVFHETCVSEWFDKKLEYMCPVCRQVFGDYPRSSNQINQEEESDPLQSRRFCFGKLTFQTLCIIFYVGLFWLIVVFCIVEYLIHLT